MPPDITFSVAVRSTRKLRIFVEDLHRVTRQLARLEAFFNRPFAVPLVGCDEFAPFLPFASTHQGDMTQQFATCRCQYCNNGIEFDALRAGEIITCPHCQMETKLYVPIMGIPVRETSPLIQPKLSKKRSGEEKFIMWWVLGSIAFALFTTLASKAQGDNASLGYCLFMGMAMYFGMSCVAFVYFLPTYIAKRRQKKNFAAIFVLNFLAGWTFIGWVVAAVWASTKD